MRSGNDLFLWPEFYLWPAARRNDTKRPPSSPVQRRRGWNREILPIPDFNLLWSKIWAILCLLGRPQLGIYKHCRSPPCISTQRSTQLARELRERRQL